MEYTDIRYSDIPMCIDSVSARAAQLGDRWSPNELCEGEQSHAYIIKHPISTQLTPCDGIHSHQVQWHYYVYWFCECQSSTTGDGWSPNELCGGEQSHAYIIKHPIETQLTSCDGIHSHQVQWHYYVYWFCECQSSTTGDRWSPKWIVWGEQSHAYIIMHPISTQLTPCDGIHWHQVQWHPTCIDSVSARAGELGDGWSPNELCEGEQSHAYIIKHPISTQLTSCDGIHWIRYSDITTCIDSVSARAAQLGDGWSPNELLWGRAVSCLHNQAPNLNTIDSLWWEYTDIRYSDITTCIDSVRARAGELGTDGLQMNCVRESSLMLT